MPRHPLSLSARDGTFDFCSRCPAHANCCSRVKPGGEVETPILFPDDIKAIEEDTGKKAGQFSEGRQGNAALWMRSGEAGCYFYQSGSCAIYEVRPIDCRLFPMDLWEKRDGRVMLIAYTRLCPVQFDPKQYLRHAEYLLRRLGHNVKSYARAAAPGMEHEPYIVLGEVKVDGKTITVEETSGNNGNKYKRRMWSSTA